MQEKIKHYSAEINAFEPKNAEELENFRIQFLGRKGILNELSNPYQAKRKKRRAK
jgi:phenylalanyl-tRNA synthetase alpha chain